ncbi:hypothetical protein PGB90_003833 [Kerria lacca]
MTNNSLTKLGQVSKQRTKLKTNEHSLDHSRQPDFHLQQRARCSMSQCLSIPASVGNMKLLREVGVRDSSVKSRARVSASRTDCIPENYVKHVIEMNEEKYCDKIRFSRNKFSPRIKICSISSTTNDEDPNSDSSEELQYGPGIVNKLKTKYMSMTLRDNQKKGLRPSLSNMRKASSLDNLLDEDLLNGDNSYQISSVINCVNKLEYSNKESNNCLTLNFCTDLKRARSMETLQEDKTNVPNVKSVVVSKMKVTNQLKSSSVYENGLSIPLDSIANEDIIIVENSISEVKHEEKRRNCFENKELPPPDVVRETLKIFENCQKKISNNVKSWKSQKQENSGTKPVCTSKPVLYPKPVISSIDSKKYIKRPEYVENGCEEKKLTKNGIEHHNDFQSSSLCALKVNFEKAKSPRILSNTTSINNEKNSNNVNVKSNLQTMSSTIEKIVVSDSLKKIPLERVPKENGLDEYRNQNDNECKYARYEILKPLDTLPVRQVGIIRPLLSSKMSPVLTPQEIEKNYINTKKNLDLEQLNDEKEKLSESTPPMKKNNCINNTSHNVNKPSTLWFNKPWNQHQNTMVFNFKDRKEVPDYIENDGLLYTPNRERAKKILQESGGTGYIILGIENGVDNRINESSTDSPSISCKEDWQLISGPPSPCNVHFEGDNVLINGKSNLQKHPKEKKLRIQFSDNSTTFEYPSEASLLEEDFQNILNNDDKPSMFSAPDIVMVPNSTSNEQSLSGSGLASYVPSKLSMGESFELGVTKTNCTYVINSKINSQNDTAVDQQENSDYLKPAAENDNVAWSEESIPDLLF